MAATDLHSMNETVVRIESPKLIAGLARIVRGLGLAELASATDQVPALAESPN